MRVMHIFVNLKQQVQYLILCLIFMICTSLFKTLGHKQKNYKNENQMKNQLLLFDLIDKSMHHSHSKPSDIIKV